MRSRINGVFVVLTLMLSALTWSGCSKKSQPPGKDAGKAQSQYSVSKAQSQYSGKGAGKAQAQPSDEDIIKAIDDSGIMKREDGSLTVVPPVKVVQKGKQDKNGSWPVKVQCGIGPIRRSAQPAGLGALFSSLFLHHMYLHICQ